MAVTVQAMSDMKLFWVFIQMIISKRIVFISLKIAMINAYKCFSLTYLQTMICNNSLLQQTLISTTSVMNCICLQIFNNMVI